MSCRLPLLALCAALPSAAAAQGIIALDEIIVSGGIAPLAADAYGRAHTVLTAEEIKRRGITTIQDALRALPGVSVSSLGAGYTQVRIRGGEATHTLILIDGIKAAGGADEYVLSGLETANIERIEVLRGPQSVFYGSNASAGVINIITRKGGPGLSHGGAVEAGNGAAGAFHLSQRGARGGVALNLSARDDRGFDQSGSGGGKDGVNRKTIGLAADWQATPDLTFGITLRRSTERYEYDATSWAATDAAGYVVDADLFGDRDEFQGGVWAEYVTLGGRLTHRLDYQDTIHEQRDNDGYDTRGQTRKLKYRASLGLDGQPVGSAAHLLNLLAEHQRDESTSAPGESRVMSSAALEYRAFLDNGLDLQAGLRHDANRSFSDFTSWTLGLSYQVPGQPFRLHASAGTGLVNPSFFELFADADYGSSVYVGNPGLRPEKNRGYDVGIEFQLPENRGIIDVTYFNESLEDEIESYLDGIDNGIARFTFRNQTGKSPREGIELTARTQATDRLTLGANYTFLRARNPDGSVEVRRPRHELGLNASLAVLDGRGFVSGDLRHVAGNFDTQFWGTYETVELPSYTVVNLAAGYDLNQNVRVTGRIVNLFDEAYSDVWGYASQGRTGYVGLQARW
ncbi:TonB-dependent receptor plug domain-containing protein [Plastorhodobacter daqingensis]|uniref:TonB-dependent receptor plug domain-containing protein n=1 Tax=Plastorhodobacter daqingensis TaxID=1387281 RepID=A0ABW2UKS8_9RHOB